ncbi:MAG: GNAT family N-acetyltransferase [Schaedlerella sp.]|nr:GNAT family N-acetyltransferase [Schaedlerella sp.]
MILRKLDPSEHVSTRPLYEAVFTEDTEEFLDYYYFLKIKDNEIYVIEEDGKIRSMLHLNPYTINVEDTQFVGHYIVAVATEENYRKRKYMQKLLCTSMQEMYNRKEPFTFLMPAAEAIYFPYDFRFVYNQKKEKVSGNSEEPRVELKEASILELSQISRFFAEYFADKYQVYVNRDKKYYRTALMEQQSQYGGIMLMKSQGNIVGTFFYSKEGELAIREPLCQNEYKEEFYKAVRKIKGTQEDVEIYASFGDGEDIEKKPLIMARILHLESFLSMLKIKKDEVLDCSFAVLDAVLIKNSRIVRVTAGQDGKRNIKVRETEDSEGVLTIAALTSFLFGYKSIEQIKEEPDVILSQHLEEELRKIEPLKKIFLNEVV